MSLWWRQWEEGDLGWVCIPQIFLERFLFLPQSSGCDQTYETCSTGSESNINEEGLERQKRGSQRGKWYKEKKTEFVLCKNREEMFACRSGSFCFSWFGAHRIPDVFTCLENSMNTKTSLDFINLICGGDENRLQSIVNIAFGYKLWLLSYHFKYYTYDIHICILRAWRAQSVQLRAGRPAFDSWQG